MPPEHAARYIAEFFRVLKPGGIAAFQIPAGRTAFDGTLAWIVRCIRINTISRVKHWWRRLRGRPVIGMHGTPRPEVEALIRRSGGRIVAVAEDTAAGRGWKSFRYYAVRDAAAGSARPDHAQRARLAS